MCCSRTGPASRGSHHSLQLTAWPQPQAFFSTEPYQSSAMHGHTSCAATPMHQPAAGFPGPPWFRARPCLARFLCCTCVLSASPIKPMPRCHSTPCRCRIASPLSSPLPIPPLPIHGCFRPPWPPLGRAPSLYFSLSSIKPQRTKYPSSPPHRLQVSRSLRRVTTTHNHVTAFLVP